MTDDQPQSTREPAAAARRFVRACNSGALATLSRRHPGHPFASLVVFALDRDACPVILVSRLAEHSRNLKYDPRTSLLVHRASSDPQADARVTLLANALEHTPDQMLLARCLRQVPEARELLEFEDFRFLVLRPFAIRYIGGFGAVHWIEPGDYAPSPSDIPDAEADLLGAIASSHEAELRELCRRRLGHEPARFELIGLDCDGLDLRADGVRVRLDFDHPASGAADAARAAAALARAAL